MSSTFAEYERDRRVVAERALTEERALAGLRAAAAGRAVLADRAVAVCRALLRGDEAVARDALQAMWRTWRAVEGDQ